MNRTIVIRSDSEQGPGISSLMERLDTIAKEMESRIKSVPLRVSSPISDFFGSLQKSLELMQIQMSCIVSENMESITGMIENAHSHIDSLIKIKKIEPVKTKEPEKKGLVLSMDYILLLPELVKRFDIDRNSAFTGSVIETYSNFLKKRVNLDDEMNKVMDKINNHHLPDSFVLDTKTVYALLLAFLGKEETVQAFPFLKKPFLDLMISAVKQRLGMEPPDDLASFVREQLSRGNIGERRVNTNLLLMLFYYLQRDKTNTSGDISFSHFRSLMNIPENLVSVSSVSSKSVLGHKEIMRPERTMDPGFEIFFFDGMYLALTLPELVTGDILVFTHGSEKTVLVRETKNVSLGALKWATGSISLFVFIRRYGNQTSIGICASDARTEQDSLESFPHAWQNVKTLDFSIDHLLVQKKCFLECVLRFI